MLNVSKRSKFTLHSLLLGATLYLFSANEKFLFVSIVLFAIIIVLGNLIIHKENKPTLIDAIYTSLLPLNLVAGSMLTLHYFPNLSFLFKMIFIVGFVFLNYVISLVNNVFLVVQSREEPIPLYRVALTWSKIVIVVLCIPFYAGIFKIPANTFIQSGFVGLSAYLFCLFTIWSMKFESDVKKHGAGESIYLSFIGAVWVVTSNLIVSFIPTESFLRALFVASVLMFIVNYIYSHFKNSINKRLVAEHVAISLFFLSLLILFKP